MPRGCLLEISFEVGLSISRLLLRIAMHLEGCRYFEIAQSFGSGCRNVEIASGASAQLSTAQLSTLLFHFVIQKKRGSEVAEKRSPWDQNILKGPKRSMTRSPPPPQKKKRKKSSHLKKYRAYLLCPPVAKETFVIVLLCYLYHVLTFFR